MRSKVRVRIFENGSTLALWLNRSKRGHVKKWQKKKRKTLLRVKEMAVARRQHLWLHHRQRNQRLPASPRFGLIPAYSRVPIATFAAVPVRAKKWYCSLAS